MEVNAETNEPQATRKTKMTWRKLRLSLKYRPDIMKYIMKMKKNICKKNILISKLKSQLKLLDKGETAHSDSTTQTNLDNDIQATNNKISANVEPSEEKGWKTDGGEKEKSIADQVKEVAQSALQQSGMVYVESAGMYYDYKTGYYYNSELGLYYHSDTGCYYYYSDEKQSFVFHSYPDRSQIATNAAFEAHERRKARKQKRGKEEGRGKPKRQKLSTKKHENKAGKTTDDSRMNTNDVRDSPKDSKDSITDAKDSTKIIKDTKDSTDDTKDSTKDSKDSIKNKVEKELEDMKNDGEENINDRKVISKEDEETKNVEQDQLEDGECSKTASEDSEKAEESDASTSTVSDDESVAKHHPPCMRVIVRETTLPKLKVGSLFLVTKDGGTVGREGDQHTIVIRDTNVSRNHLDIRYDAKRNIYVATDLGSKNGTILNGTRMSESQIVSAPVDVMHGSTIELGETKLLCHIHPGNDTCGHCEPGLIMENHEKEKVVAYSRSCSVQKQHQLELARLKNKYAPKQLAIEETAYNDRAQTRRVKVGSSHHAEKTMSSDVDTFIAPENKGFKLLEKMGWSKGEGLGKDGQGDVEPVPLVSNEGKLGLGSVAPPLAPLKINALGKATLHLANRSKLLKPPAKAFQNPLGDESDED